MRSGNFCQKLPHLGRNRCRLHGGLSLVGKDHPNYKHTFKLTFKMADMKKILHTIIFLVLIFGYVYSAVGQEFKSLSLENSNPNIQSDTVLVISILPSEPNYCGLRVEWGDGSGQDYRLERSGSEPIKLTKRYSRIGDFTISVKGKLLIRGLKTAASCKGQDLALSIKVIDTEQQKQKAEIDRVSEQLKTEETIRQQLELRLREEQIKQKESELKQKEEDLLKQKIQVEIEAKRLKEEAAKKAAIEKKSDQPAPIPRRQF